MSQFLLLCAVLSVANLLVLQPGYEYVQDADAWLRLHKVPANWGNARLRCQLEGGILASPSNSAIVQAMLTQMTRHKVASPTVFTGIHSLNTELDFTSLDGKPLSEIELDWAPNEPNDDNEEEQKCVVLNEKGQVADVNCASKYPYFCKKDSAAMNATNDCPTTVRGYKYQPLTGSCYKFHRFSQPWNRAARICHAEGGHLAIVNDAIEATVLKHIFEKNPVEDVVGAIHSDVALIGIWKWEDDGDWMTIFGETLEKAGYAKWSDGVELHADHGAIQRSGLLDAVAKFDKDPFICEIEMTEENSV
ncbi:macrophage mannose receptor 1-like [Leguminivora glycinivorella]|uniref:macrophage mannose receptor 1-like n=1 Tax=Leguminivora glycinivorella TaxID=1035111 RepID=UPI00200D1FAD|nr:macrophage mannose receptor 1-like [Leguminivora glycinivorella]